MIAPGTDALAPELSARLDSTDIDAAGGSLRHLVVTVRAPEVPVRPDVRRQPLNIALVIDARRLRRARPAIRGSCAGVPELEALLGGLDSFAPSLLARYSAASSKEMLLHSYKLSRHEADHRGHPTASFSLLLAQERRARRRS